MTVRKPLVNIGGQVQELPVGDSVAFDGEYLTTATTRTVKASGGDFTTLSSAWDWAMTVHRKPGITVTLQVDPGTWTHTSPLETKAGGGYVEVVGTYHTTTLTSVASSSGSAGNYSYVLNVGSTTNIAAGDWVGIEASGGTNPNQLQGGFEVTAIGSGTITVKATHNAIAAVASGAVTGIIYVYRTVLKFNSCDGFRNQIADAAVKLSNVAVVGNDHTALTRGVLTGLGATTILGASSTDRVLVGGFVANVLLTSQGNVYGYAIFIGRCSSAYAGSCWGIYLEGNSRGYFDYARINCNSSSSSLVAGFQIAGSFAYCQLASISGISGSGVYAQRVSMLNLYGTIAFGCTTGVSAYYVTSIDFQTGAATSCTTATSPAVNTAGNGNSYINQ